MRCSSTHLDIEPVVQPQHCLEEPVLVSCNGCSTCAMAVPLVVPEHLQQGEERMGWQ